MAHEMTERDGAVYYGKPAWHGLGVVVDKAPSPAEALQIAGLDWSVESAPIIARRERVVLGDDGIPGRAVDELPVESWRAQVRSDTGEVLAVVGSGYRTIQNRDLVSLIYETARADGVTVETMGSFRSGRVVYACAHLDTFQLGERDRSHVYALFTNAHDGTAALRVLPTSVRVVCANTHRAALGRREAQTLTVNLRHSSGIRDRLDEVRAVLKGARAVAEREREMAEALNARRMGDDDVKRFFVAVWEKLYGAIPSGTSLSRGDKGRRTRALEAISAWWSRLEGERAELDAPASAWLAANAPAAWVEHERPTRNGAERRHSAILGSGAVAKDTVFEMAGSM